MLAHSAQAMSRGSKPVSVKERSERVHAPRSPDGFERLVTALGGGTLDFTAMLAIADLLPVMIAYVDRDFKYRFVNRPLAEWLDVPRRELIGRSMREVLGEQAFEQRAPMLASALAGQRQYFASEFDYGPRGAVAVQTDYVPWADSSGEVQGIIVLVQEALDRSRRSEHW